MSFKSNIPSDGPKLIQRARTTLPSNARFPFTVDTFSGTICFHHDFVALASIQKRLPFLPFLPILCAFHLLRGRGGSSGDGGAASITGRHQQFSPIDGDVPSLSTVEVEVELRPRRRDLDLGRHQLIFLSRRRQSRRWCRFQCLRAEERGARRVRHS